MQAVADQLDLDVLNPAFEKMDAVKIIDWSYRQFGDDLVMTSSFGDQAVALIHLATQIKPDIRIIFVDTGYLFPETHLYMEQVRQRFSLNVWTYRTKNDPIQYLKDVGENDPTHRKDRDACCAANKNEPIERAFKTIGAKAYLRGIRRQQAKTLRVLRDLANAELEQQGRRPLHKAARSPVPSADRKRLPEHRLQSPLLHASRADRRRPPLRKMGRQRQNGVRN